MPNRSNPPLEILDQLPLDDESRAYIRYHAPRYQYLFDLISESSPKTLGTVLDIGPAYQTLLLQSAFADAQVDTLGFADERFPAKSGAMHYEFDLNDAQWPERVPRIGPYNLILMGEVIEHLYTAPELVLQTLHDWTKSGGQLIIQTPNALALPKRLKLMVGRHPYERIRLTRTNPGHFRESTGRELAEMAHGAGWEVVRLIHRNYFAGTSIANRIYNFTSPLLPPTWRAGISLVLRRTK